MFAKLLKYEYRSYLKSLLPMWGAILLLSVINGFTLPLGAQTGGGLGFFTTTLPMLLFVISFLVMAVITLVLTLQRFFHGLLGSEGYLMFTLPVSRSQLIASKLFVSVTVQLMGGLVACLSGLILGALLGRKEFFGLFPQIFSSLGDLFRTYSGKGWVWALIGVELFGILLLTMANSALHLYAAMALGHLSKKQKVAGSVVAWVGLNILFTNGSLKLISLFLNSTGSAWIELEQLSDFPLPLFALMLVIAIQGAIYWAITEWILNRKLNLE